MYLALWHGHILAVLVLLVSIVTVPAFGPSHPEYVGFDTTEFDKCIVGKYHHAFGLGSWDVSIKKIESDRCFLEINHEIEGGWSKIFCSIPLDELNSSNWEEATFPLENSDQYCELISSGVFTKMLQVHASPLKQIRIGIDTGEVICKEELELIIKHNQSPACVRLDTAVTLEERGWGVMPPPCCKDMPHLESQIEDVPVSYCSGSAGCFNEIVTRIVDGDTIYTKTLNIRLSLTNTPEKNESGFSEATQFTAKLCPVGSEVLVDQDDLQKVDIYGRVLAKVFCEGKVLNSELLYAGHANISTRYCSTSEFSGEDWAQEYGCASNPNPALTHPQQTPLEHTCDPSYPTVCIPLYPPDLDCGEITYSNFKVLQPDPHGFDGDKDGIGCEN